MDIVFRAVVVFCFLLFLMRIVGRRELSTLEPFDLVLLIVIGDLVQQGVTQSDHSVTGAILAAGTFGVLVVVVSYLSFRFRRVRPVVEGEPMIVLQDGKPIDRNLRRERITLEELAAAARLQGISALDQVQWGVLETSGQISFIRKST
jgi:uncharacterized membrane protein YcaP (DUF421 family)